jgi:hypothetical protein
MHAAPAAELSCDALFDRCRVVDLLQRSDLLLSDVLEGEAVHPKKPTSASPTGRSYSLGLVATVLEKS